MRAIIDSSRMEFGEVNLSTWDNKATDVRCRRSYRADADPVELPEEVAIVTDPCVQAAAETLCRLYKRPRAVFSIKVEGGVFQALQVYDGSPPG